MRWPIFLGSSWPRSPDLLTAAAAAAEAGAEAEAESAAQGKVGLVWDAHAAREGQGRDRDLREAMTGALLMEASAAVTSGVALRRPRPPSSRQMALGEQTGFVAPRQKLCTNSWTAEPILSRKYGCRGQAFAQGANGSVAPAECHPITLHVGETSFTMPFSSAAAKGLNAAIDGLFQTFKEREKAARPQRWKTMEYRQTGEGVFLEVFCNPNAYSNAFQAKVLITIKDEKIKIASEGQLSTLKADIDQYVDQVPRQ